MEKITNNIICMKWGDKFGADYVNRLYKMVKRNVTVPFRFVCFTENSEGIVDGVEVKPLPPMDLDESLPEKGWRKLTLFQPQLADLEGTALFLDLDIVIKANIDCFFKEVGEFLIIRDYDFQNDIVGNSSVFRFELGKHNYVLDNFLTNGEYVRKNFKNEQAYLSYAIYDNGILKYWDNNWVVSFKRQCLYPFPVNFFKTAKEPKLAKIVIFHGRPTPQQARNGYFGKGGFRYVRPVKWLDKYWV